MKQIILGLSFAALFGAASAAGCEMTDIVDIPITVPVGTEPVVLEVHLGPLPGKAQMRLLTTDGVLVGSLGAFGVMGVAPAGFPHIAVERRPELTGEIHLTGQIIFNGTERPATKEELRGIRVVSP
ncbi:MAG: hypothetical protein ACSHXB_05405 [Sulfitobacter sp.]